MNEAMSGVASSCHLREKLPFLFAWIEQDCFHADPAPVPAETEQYGSRGSH